MKKLAVTGLSLLLSLFGAVGALAAGTTTVTGHLRDGLCFTTMGAMGSTHRECALACAKAGIPVMLVEDGSDKGYVLLPPKDKQGLPASVTDKMEGEVTVTGHAYTKNGISYLQVESVK